MKQFILLGTISAALCLTGHAQTTPIVVNDVKILKSFETSMGELAEAGEMVNTDELLPQLKKTSCDITLPSLSTQKPDNVYATAAQSVVVIGSVYKCDKCPLWHTGSVATGWVLSSDGIMVTNYHVFSGKKVAGFGIRTLDGKVAPVVEILAASAKDDVAIFRVKGEGFKPLAIGKDAGVGASIHIIAHPDKRFFTYTAGNVSRYFRKRSNVGGQIDAMAVTADFARGSSGGPVINGLGNVVGMVSSTRSLYATSNSTKDPKRNFQMVIGNCVPAASIRNLIKK